MRELTKRPYNEMNFTEFQVQLRCCLIIKDGFDNEWMHDFYSEFREDYDRFRFDTVKEWAEFFFQDIRLDTHSFSLTTQLHEEKEKS